MHGGCSASMTASNPRPGILQWRCWLQEGYAAGSAPARHRRAGAGASRRPSRLRREAHAARPDQAGIGRLEAPEGPADRPLQVDVLVVRTTESEVGRHQIAIRHRHETENNAARIDLDDTTKPGHCCPKIALDVVMDAVGAAVAGDIGASLDALKRQMQRILGALRTAHR